VIEKVPQTWRIADLGKIAKEFISGGTPSTKEAKFWDGDIPWTTSAPISDTDIFLDCGQRFISLEGLENSASHLVPKGNLLVGTRVGVGKAVVNLIDIAISQDLTGIVLNSSATPAFIAYQFKTQRVTSFFFGRKRGTTIKGIARLDLHALPLSIPPLTEQQAIVQALQAVQEAREARRREAALERERKAALMDYLFTHGTHDEPRQQTEIGEIPQSWRLVQVDNLKAPIKGSLVAGPFGSNIGKKFFVESGVPLIRGNNLTKGDRFFIDGGFVFITREKAQELKSCEAIKNDLIITAAGTLGQIGIIPQDSIYSRYIISNKQIRLRIDDKIIFPLLIFYWFSTSFIQNLIKKYNSGTSIPVINLGIIRRLPIPLASMSEQKEIIEVLEICRAKIAALEHEAELLEELFRAMLEELMNGRLSALPLVEAEGTA
jgi:type I restriction enzyme S subunit